VAVAQRKRPSISVTLPADLIQRLEADAQLGNVSISQVIEAYCREHYQGAVVQHLEHLESSLNELKASVLPVVAKVANYLQELEGEVPVAAKGDGQPPKIATYEEMYGPITRAVPPDPPQAPVEPPPRRRWPWQG
jgi:Ribbon-helix-helix protein, copG family